MRFRISHTAYLHMPVSDGAGGTRIEPRLIRADSDSPVEIELPDDADPNHISRRWEPLDELARAAQAKLGPLGRPDIPASAERACSA